MSADLAEGESRLLYPPPGLLPGRNGASSAGLAYEDLRVVAARHPGRWLANAAAIKKRSETNPPGLPKTEE